MSHTTKVNSVKIVSVTALQEAVRALKDGGVRCELVENEKPRMYYQDQHGTCDYVLRLSDCPYDVGFDRNEDGSYAPVLDTWQGRVAECIGFPGKGASGAIGKLTKEYTKAAVIEAATEQGYTVYGTEETEDGGYRVQIMV